MVSRQRFVVWWCLGIVFTTFLLPPTVQARVHRHSKVLRAPRVFRVNARSAVLLDMNDGRVLYEQNADAHIPPASITKIISLYIVFDAIRQGRLHPSDSVPISARAASMTGSRMHIKAGQVIPLEELIKGMAVVSGNDACVAVAQYLCGSEEAFVRLMNQKARELGMTNTHFVNTNGLPADGQYTTAADIAKLSVSYLHHYPEALAIHSMRSLTFNNITHRNANRLLGTCPGVDGIKTGFVCAAGYNISATAKRGNVRLLAVLLGAPSPGVRAAEAAKLLDRGFREVAPGAEPEVQVVQQTEKAPEPASSAASGQETHPAGSKLVKKIKVVRIEPTARSARAGKAKSSRVGRSAKLFRQAKAMKAAAAHRKHAVKQAQAVKTKKSEHVKHAAAAKPSKAAAKVQALKPAKAKTAKAKPVKVAKAAKISKKNVEPKKVSAAHPKAKSTPSAAKVPKKAASSQKSHQHAQNTKEKRG